MTIDELNRRYGTPGRIVFRAGFAGYPEVVLANKFGAAEIALLGGNVLSYRPTGHSPVLFRSAKRDYNRGESIHGGMPVCWPQFGNRAIAKMPQHGFARVSLFSVLGTEFSEEVTEIRLGLSATEETKKIWPYDFDVELKISVSMKLNASLKTKNTGKEAFSFSAGFHPYLRVADRDATQVRGVEGLEFIDASLGETAVQGGPFLMNAASDHVFKLMQEPKHEFALLDPKAHRAIGIATTGGNNLVIWNPGTDWTPPDCAADDYKKFVCVEPVTDWPAAGITLKPGEEHTLLVAIQSTAEESAAK